MWAVDDKSTQKNELKTLNMASAKNLATNLLTTFDLFLTVR